MDANQTSVDPTKLPRVLIVAASPRYVGGQSVMAQRLVQDLAASGITVEFLAVDPLLPRVLRPLDGIKYVRTMIRTFFYLSALLRNVPKCDIVHVFSASYASFLISPAPALLIARLFGKCSVLNYHSGEAEDHLLRSGRVTKLLIGSATTIVVPSAYLVTVFARFGFKASAIYNHINIEGFKYRERAHLHPRIIVARTLDILYNISCALRTFKLIQEQHPQAELLILGDGPLRSELERETRDLRLANVTFRGFVQRSDIPRLYDEADVFLNTSSIDNMPVSILEAYATGLPVVTTNAGGIPYIVADGATGLLANVDDHVALARRVLSLLDCPDKAVCLSRAGREEVNKYRWDSVGPQWISLYRHLNSTRRGAEPVTHKQCQTSA